MVCEHNYNAPCPRNLAADSAKANTRVIHPAINPVQWQTPRRFANTKFQPRNSPEITRYAQPRCKPSQRRLLLSGVCTDYPYSLFDISKFPLFLFSCGFSSHVFTRMVLFWLLFPFFYG